MKKIDLTKPPENLTVMVHGATGSGKTRFAATWPRPRFLSDMSEKGYETIRTMPKSAFYDPAFTPEVWGIERPKDMLEGIEETAKEVVSKPGSVLTLVIDSLTFYADMYFDALERMEPPGKPDTRKLYGLLLGHLRRVMIRTHELPLNIVWLALTKQPEDGMSGIMVAGKSAEKLPAACQYMFYMRAFNDGPNSVKREARTKQFGPYPARCRDGGTLSDPLPEPTYKCLINELMNNNKEKK